MKLEFDGPLLLVGAGKMGGAMLSGWLARGLAPADVIVVDPSPSAEIGELLTKHGIQIEAGAPKLDTAPAVILMAVKPQVMDAV